MSPRRPIRRRAVLGACAGVLAGPVLAAAQPARYPSRPITLLVPWPAGGQTDITMRILAELAGRQLGQPIVVANRPGAAGTLVGPALRAAVPDGHVIGQRSRHTTSRPAARPFRCRSAASRKA